MAVLTPPRLLADSPAPREQGVPLVVEIVDCPSCGSEDHETIVYAEDHLTRIGGSFRVARCTRCQLAFTNPRPTRQCLRRFYPENYAPYSGHEIGPRPNSILRRRLEHAVLRKRFRHPPQPTDARTALTSLLGRVVIRRSRAREHWIPYCAPGRLLDFGCGAGDFMKRMRAYGWNVEGLDFSASIVVALREGAGLRVHLGTLPHPDIRPESFDVVTMWQSLEHMPGPREVLRAAYTTLRPGGALVIGVPNFASWSFRRFQQNWTGLDLPRHLTHFTPQTLSRMVETEGFRVLSVQQIGRVGSLRKSARRAAQHGGCSPQLRSLRWRWCANPVTRWTEWSGQADSFRLIAEKA